jgi:hypothetical protein
LGTCFRSATRNIKKRPRSVKTNSRGSGCSNKYERFQVTLNSHGISPESEVVGFGWL